MSQDGIGRAGAGGSEIKTDETAASGAIEATPPPADLGLEKLGAPDARNDAGLSGKGFSGKIAGAAVQGSLLARLQEMEAKAAAGPAGKAAVDAFKADLAAKAQDPKAFHAAMKEIFGSNYDQAKVEALRGKALQGDFGFLPKNILFAAPDALGDAQAAYSPKNGGTIVLSRDLIGDPKALASAFAEEAGHHVDALLQAPKGGFDKALAGQPIALADRKDAASDEGERLAGFLATGKVPDRAAAVDGKGTLAGLGEVEFKGGARKPPELPAEAKSVLVPPPPEMPSAIADDGSAKMEFRDLEVADGTAFAKELNGSKGRESLLDWGRAMGLAPAPADSPIRQLAVQIDEVRGAFENANEAFNATVATKGTEVLEARDRDVKSGAIAALNKKVGGDKVATTLEEYEAEKKAANDALKTLKKVTSKEVEAGLAGVAAAESRLGAKEKEQLKKIEEKKAAELEATIKSVESGVTTFSEAIQAAAGGQAKFLEFLQGKAIAAAEAGVSAVLTADTRKELVAIQAKIAAYDEAIASDEFSAVKSDLVKAKKELEAKLGEAEGLVDEYVDHQVNAWKKIDTLARLEKDFGDPKTGPTVFSKMKEYQTAVAERGASLAQATVDYRSMLSRTPLGDQVQPGAPFAPSAKQVIEESKRHEAYIRKFYPEGPEKEQALRDLEATRKYATEVEKWRKEALDSSAKIPAAFKENKHFGLNDRIADDVLTGSFGRSAKTSQITR